jgi:polynucleotide 5'-kinase involved in rRNA processing
LDDEIKDLTAQRAKLTSFIEQKESTRQAIEAELCKLCGNNIKIRHFVCMGKVVVVTADDVVIYKAE